MFSLFTLQTIISRVYPWILVHVINISPLKEQIASQSEGIFAVGRKDYATGQENHLWVNLTRRFKAKRRLDQRSSEKYGKNLSFTKFCFLRKFPQHLSNWTQNFLNMTVWSVPLKAEDKFGMKACNASQDLQAILFS